MTEETFCTVTVAGVLADRASFWEAPSGETEASAIVELGDNSVAVFADGPIARNLMTFGAAGAEIVAVGELVWNRPEIGSPCVRLHRLAFAHPRQVGELCGWFDGRGVRREDRP